MTKKLKPIFLCILLASYAGSHLHYVAAKEAKHQRKQGAAPTAASLISDMQKAVAFTAMSAKDRLSTKSKEARPFWAALKTASQSLDIMEASLKSDKTATVKAQDDLGRSMIQLCASWGVLRGSHPKLQVGRGVIALSEAHDMYTYHFGPTVARYKLGGKPAKEELEAVEICLDELAKLGDDVEALSKKAKANSYQARLVNDLLSLIDELLEVKVTNLKSYCKFMYQWDRLSHAVGGYSEIIEVWYPAYYTEWETVTADYTSLVDEFTEVSVSYYEAWEYTELSVAKYDDYYERTSMLVSVTEEQEAEFESYTEEYSEESAIEESEEELAEINEDIEIDEDDDSTAFEEVEDSADDEDGDGESDEEDTDDDNDGVEDDQDSDDDGDGLEDSEDEDEEEDTDEGEEDEDEDDDGIDDDEDGGDE
ncbi:MAG: hypothetical protein ACOYOF_07780 [Verrucomicrobiaceae bacterium]